MEFAGQGEGRLIQAKVIAEQGLLLSDHHQVPDLTCEVSLLLLAVSHTDEPVFIFGRKVKCFDHILACNLSLMTATEKILIEMVDVMLDKTPELLTFHGIRTGHSSYGTTGIEFPSELLSVTDDLHQSNGLDDDHHSSPRIFSHDLLQSHFTAKFPDFPVHNERDSKSNIRFARILDQLPVTRFEYPEGNVLPGKEKDTQGEVREYFRFRFQASQI